MCSHVFGYLKCNNLLTLSQSGFIPGDSTTSQLLFCLYDLCRALDKGIMAQALFLDISKAFDRVWHHGRLHKLAAISICGTLLHWFKDYLKDRRQAAAVVIKGQASDCATVRQEYHRVLFWAQFCFLYIY